MFIPEYTSSWKWLNDTELPICRLLNRSIRYRWLRWLFCTATILGNGVFWYALFVLIPLIDPVDGWGVSVRMFFAGLSGLLIYKSIKYLTHRVRPYINSTTLHSPIEPLDFYSFPSGHTLHAVSLSHIITLHYPAYAVALWSFAGLIAISRITLGQHYPSDVITGGVIGWLVSKATVSLS